MKLSNALLQPDVWLIWQLVFLFLQICILNEVFALTAPTLNWYLGCLPAVTAYTYMYVRDKDRSGRVSGSERVCVCVCVCVLAGENVGWFFPALLLWSGKLMEISRVSRLPRAAVCAIITSTQEVCVCVCVCRGESVVTPASGSSPRSWMSACLTHTHTHTHTRLMSYLNEDIP